jgi:hypothetical protein
MAAIASWHTSYGQVRISSGIEIFGGREADISVAIQGSVDIL